MTGVQTCALPIYGKTVDDDLGWTLVYLELLAIQLMDSINLICVLVIHIVVAEDVMVIKTHLLNRLDKVIAQAVSRLNVDILTSIDEIACMNKSRDAVFSELWEECVVEELLVHIKKR